VWMRCVKFPRAKQWQQPSGVLSTGVCTPNLAYFRDSLPTRLGRARPCAVLQQCSYYDLPMEKEATQGRNVSPNHSTKQRGFASIFTYFLEHTLDKPAEMLFSTVVDLQALSSASFCSFQVLQPALRVKCFQANHTTSPFLHNLDIISFDKGALYRCSYCKTPYLARLPCMVCVCMTCGTCDKVFSAYGHHFHTNVLCLCDKPTL
jgi:hypothetical protein